MEHGTWDMGDACMHAIDTPFSSLLFIFIKAGSMEVQ